jgi:hypothetical protein
MAKREYYRLTRARRRAGIAVVAISSYSLWLGPDHLLLIESNGYTETYKRFYFRDIQAIIVRQTSRQRTTSIILGALAAALIGIGLIAGGISVIITYSVIAFLTCLIPLLINVLLGPTCTCQIRTAVQTEDLPVRRMGKARKILQRIRPLIAEAQGQITAEEVDAQMRVVANAPPVMAATSPSPGATYVVDDLNAPPRIIS